MLSCRKSEFIDCLNVIAVEMSIVCTEALEIELWFLQGSMTAEEAERAVYSVICLFGGDQPLHGSLLLVFQVAKHCKYSRK